MSTFAIRFPTFLFLNLCWAVVGGLWISLLLRESNECVCRLIFLGCFAASGCLDVNAAASSEVAFTDRHILHSLSLLKRPEALEVGERKLLGWQGLRLFGFLFGVVSHHGCTCTVQKNRMSRYLRQLSMRRVWRASAETSLFLIWTVLRSACCSQKKDGSTRTRRLGKFSQHPLRSSLMGHNDRVCSDFSLFSLVNSGSSTFVPDS